MKYVVYDIEVLPNIFTMVCLDVSTEKTLTLEVSPWKNDIKKFFDILDRFSSSQIRMVGFNSFHYDYPVIHELLRNRRVINNPESFCSVAYIMSKKIIGNKTSDRFKYTVWDSQMYVPQVDLFKIHHFDNKAKTVSLKRLEFNMRLPSVTEFSVDFDKPVIDDEVHTELLRYNKKDVLATYRFFKYSKEHIEFRESLVPEFGDRAMNFNDTKIGEVLIVSRLEDKVGPKELYDYEEDPFTGERSRKPKQTPRKSFPVTTALFTDKISFIHPEFKKIYSDFQEMTMHVVGSQFHWTKESKYLQALSKMKVLETQIKRMKKSKYLTKEDRTEAEDQLKRLKNKYHNKNLTCSVGGMEFEFGKGGLHASSKFKIYRSTDDLIIKDVDVTSFYPSLGIEYQMKPAHLPIEFVGLYAGLKQERIGYAKGTPQNKMLKLSLNGTYGKSNSKFSIFYDPLYTMKTTLNGQLFLAMLWDRLLAKVPGIEIIQANTDGITYIVPRKHVPLCEKIEAAWEKHTLMSLERVEYSAMFIRDVNNYFAVYGPGKNEGKLKLKGAYNYAELFGGESSSGDGVAWHKNHSNIASTKAAVQSLVNGNSVADYIENNEDIYDFCLCTNVPRSSKLLYGDKQIQRNTRYIVTNDGEELTKVMPPAGAGMKLVDENFSELIEVQHEKEEAFQRAVNKHKLVGFSELTPEEQSLVVNGVDENTTLKNRYIGINKGKTVTVFNDIGNITKHNIDIDYEFYISEAEKLTKEFSVKTYGN